MTKSMDEIGIGDSQVFSGDGQGEKGNMRTVPAFPNTRTVPMFPRKHENRPHVPKVIGIGDDGRESLLPLYERFIEESEVLIGGRRHLDFFPDYQGEKIVIEGNLSILVERLKHENRPSVFLASGDPLFYGIGGYLASKVLVEVYPNVSSVQLAFARMGERWHDVYFTSVHGRSMKGLAQRIDGRDKIAILTDAENSPNKIANYLLSFGMTEYKVFVAENLGGEQERCRWFALAELENEEFSPLNVVILKRITKGPSWPIGIEDEEFIQRKPLKGLITKKEIRTLSVSAMKLTEESVIWDIGTCTGSVAIEAGRIARFGQVFAIEKNEADLENCRANLAKFRVDATVIHGKAPEGLAEFPDPDAVFIGGTGGGMAAILDVCCRRLRGNGRIVLNAVTIENLAEAMRLFKERGFKTEISLVQISRSQPILELTRFEPLNPIYIIAAEREEGKIEC